MKQAAQPKTQKIRTPSGDEPARGLWFLTAWRASRGWTQEQVAEKIGTTKGTISKLESGERDMSEDWIKRYAQVFEIAPADLMRHPSTTNTAPKPVSEALSPHLVLEALTAFAHIAGMSDSGARTAASAVLKAIVDPPARVLDRREDEVRVDSDRIIRQFLSREPS